MSDGKVIIIVCQGCENECDVSIELRDDGPRCLGGNNCPTGESFALAQARTTRTAFHAVDAPHTNRRK